MKNGITITIFECGHCSNAHLCLQDKDGTILFSAGLPPEVWAKIFRDVAAIESRHATKQ